MFCFVFALINDLSLASGYLVSKLDHSLRFPHKFHISFNSEFRLKKIRRALEVLQASALEMSAMHWRTKAVMGTMCPIQQSYRRSVMLETRK